MHELADYDPHTGHLEGCEYVEGHPYPGGAIGCTKDCAKQLRDLCENRIGAAWDAGWESAATCYWHKPKNPITGELNDDADSYCPDHGGRADPKVCEHDSHPAPPPATCTCTTPPPFRHVLGYGHERSCPMYIGRITMPEIKVDRGGIKYGNGDQK